jgi:hypothetical protein
LIKFTNQSRGNISISVLTTELRFEVLEGNKPKEKFALPQRVDYSNAALDFISMFKFNIGLRFDIPVANSESRRIYYIVPKGSKLKSVVLGANDGIVYPIMDSTTTN